MAADVSKKTVVALLLVAIALSVAGTWVAIDTSQQQGQGYSYLPSSGQTNVALTIDGETKEPARSDEPASVSLIIK